MSRRALEVCAALVLIFMAAGLVLMGIAIHLYPGGSFVDRHCAGHSFWLNFLCDLTNDVALNGAPNVTGSRFARAAMTTFAVSVGAFWLVSPALFPEQRRTGRLVRITGVTAALGLGLIPLATGPAHAIAIYAVAGPGFVAGIAAFVATLRHGRDRLLVGAASAAMASGLVDAVLYARRVADHYQSCPPALPAFQRLGGLLMLLWMATAAWRVLGRNEPARQEPRR